MVFVFGSNLSGFHGAGAAKLAVELYGAIMDQAEGMQGDSYAIPTKAKNWKFSLSLAEVQTYVARFLEHAAATMDITYQVTRIGCGYAGFRDGQIAPMFASAPPNCLFDRKWAPWLPEDKRFWGTFN